MIELEYKHLGILKSKLLYFGDYLPDTTGYHFISCNNCFIDLPTCPPYIREKRSTILIDLSKDIDTIFGNIQSRRRNTIRQGLKHGFRLTVQKLDKDILYNFQRLYNKYVAPKGANRLIGLTTIEALMPYITAFTGEYDYDILMFMLFLHDGISARYFMGARDESLRYKKGGNLIGSALMWESILHFKKLGYLNFDLGGITLDQALPTYSISKFKMTFGGEVRGTFYYKALASKMALGFDVCERILKKVLR